MSNADHSQASHEQNTTGPGLWTILFIMIVPSALTLGWVLHLATSGQ